MNTVLFLALTSLPGTDPAATGGTCACKATTTTTTPTSVTPVASKPEKQPLFPRLSALFGRHRHSQDESPAVNPSQFNLNSYNNFRPETVIVPEPAITTVPSHQPMLLPQGPGVPSTQAPLFVPTSPTPLPQTPVPTTAEPPLN